MNLTWISGALGVAGALLGLATAMSVTASATERSADAAHRVVLHVNAGDEKVHKGILNNIRNLYEAIGTGSLKVEVVAHGAGLALLTRKDTKVGDQLARLKEQYGVEYTACSNTMQARGLVRADLVDQVDRTVPAMVRLMELQEQGWAYIKP